MNVQAIIDRARRLAYVSDRQYSNAKAIEDFNVIYSLLVDNIVKQVNENYFWDLFTTSTIIGQKEYTIPNGVIKIKKVVVGGVVYDEVDSINDDNIKNNRTYYIADNSIFLSTAPQKVETIIIEGIKGAISLSITDTEDKIIIPSSYHYIISDGIRQFIYQQRGLINEKNDAINTFNLEVGEMISSLSDRNVSPSNGILPDLTYYE